MMPSTTAVDPTVGSDSAIRQRRRWRVLSAESDREDVQEEIRGALRAGAIRVRPCPGDPQRVQILPALTATRQSTQRGDISCTDHDV
jgi:hypothetical protein